MHSNLVNLSYQAHLGKVSDFSSSQVMLNKDAYLSPFGLWEHALQNRSSGCVH